MNDERPRTRQGEAQGEASGKPGQAGVPETPGCCGPEMAEMMQGCPCGAFLKEHRVAAFAGLFLISLMLVISQVGGILGIIAFFRTL